jgi:hypothetical protein
LIEMPLKVATFRALSNVPLKQLLRERERKCHGLNQYSSHLLLYLFFRFVLT